MGLTLLNARSSYHYYYHRVRGQRSETVTSGPRLRSYSVVQDHVTHMKLEITRCEMITIYSEHLALIIRLTMNDIASYRCVARNSLGETDGRIKLYGAVTNRSCIYKRLYFIFF